MTMISQPGSMWRYRQSCVDHSGNEDRGHTSLISRPDLFLTPGLWRKKMESIVQREVGRPTATGARPGLIADTRGSVAMMFGLASLVLCGMIAFGLDYSRAVGVRTKLQHAVDSAVLAADPQSDLTLAEATANVNGNFAFNMKTQFIAANIHVDAPVVIPHGYRLTATADVPTTFGRLLGVTHIPVKAMAEAVRGKYAVEIALVLDNTASMSDSGKLDAAKTAATQLVSQIATASTPGSVKYALVPFSNYVNVGMSNRGATWMSVPNNYTEHHPAGSYMTTDWDGCPTTSEPYACTNDGMPGTCTWTHCTTPGPNRSVPTPAWDQNHGWNGCAGSRTPAADLTVGASFASPIPGILDVGCPSELTRLTTNETTITNQIAGMVAQGDTYIPAGVMWGLRVLSPNAPFADGAAYNSVKKIMIVMTDGFNTKSQNGTNHEGTNTSDADQAMGQLCTVAKTSGVEMYTIAFKVTDTGIKQNLQTCASSATHYYDAQDNQALSDAFNKISGSVVKLALSR
jgi:Flp pilus assembly protein TadG